MKFLSNTIFAIALLVIVALFTKPSDENCKQQAARYLAGSGVVGDLFASNTILQANIKVLDYGVFKAVYDRIGGNQIGIGAFSTVFFFH